MNPNTNPFSSKQNFPPLPENISSNSIISSNDPEVPKTPDYGNNSDFDTATVSELFKIMQTPPNDNSQSGELVRKTPGAELTEQNKRTEDVNNKFQLLQALQNLKESTVSEQTSNVFNSALQRDYREQYSLFGSSSYFSSNNLMFNQQTNNSNYESPQFSPWGSSVHNNIHPFNSLNMVDNSMYGNNNPIINNSYGNSELYNQNLMFSGGSNSGHNYYNNLPNNIAPNSNSFIGYNLELNHQQQTNLNIPNSSINLSNTPHHHQSTSHVSFPHPEANLNIISHREQRQPTHRRQLSSGISKPSTPSHKRSSSTSSYNINQQQKQQVPKEPNPPSRDLTDSPTSNMKFKQFYRGFKQKEKEGYEEASKFAIEHLEILPEKVHWRIFLELADLAKRENRISEAREYYENVNELQPTAAQGWLEYAKMEEECGNLDACKRILSNGLSNCAVNESLMVKCLKHFERMKHLNEARALLGALKDIPVERTWRTIMEGGLLEARQGNIGVARQVFHYLIKNVPWYGPIYQEACRFEEKCEEHENAMKFVEMGLKENSRYGPLWFSALRLNEKLSKNGDISAMHDTIERAVKSISRELIWKLYFEAAQIEERAGNIKEARDFYVFSVNYCPDNLLWKVWMGGARTELNYNNIEIARELLKRALEEVPPKMKAMVLLERCRLEEYAGELNKARDILNKAKKYTKHEWKVFLESVLLEMRANNLERAIHEATEALSIHTGTGRLWAVMIQLKQSQGIEAQMNVFGAALCEVPKSGEVWCEGARIALHRKDFILARKYIDFAIQFTPQYGDSFIEYLRLEILENGENANLKHVEQLCVNADPNYGALWLHCKQHPLDSTRNVIRQAIHILTTPISSVGDEVPAATALMVNDIYLNIHERSNKERRKAIFL